MSNIGSMVERLATGGLVPYQHNLVIWQHADGSGWSASIETAFPHADAVGVGASLEEALKELMRVVNRGADIK